MDRKDGWIGRWQALQEEDHNLQRSARGFGDPLEVSLKRDVRHRRARQEARWCRRCS